MKKKFRYFCIIFLMFIITGCNNKDINNSDPILEEKENIKIIDLNSNSRPYAVSINNHPVAIKAQTGLNKAYMVYEFPIEGGLTRSLALFKDVNDVKVGTIRSARKDYIDYVLENDAIFVHFGWEQHIAKNDILNLKIDYIDGDTRDGKAFKRENPFNLAWEHRVYTNLSTIIDYAKNKMKYRITSDAKPVLNYVSHEVNLNSYADSLVVDKLELKYSNSFKVKFVYDSSKQRYDRYMNGKLHKDYITGEKFDTKNIIVILLDWGRLPYKDSAGNRYLDMYNEGNGNGYYITNGYARKITWEKKDRASQTVYRYLDGEEVKVNDGNTYVMFYSKDKTVTIN